jgi:hypothetical protein
MRSIFPMPVTWAHLCLSGKTTTKQLPLRSWWLLTMSSVATSLVVG